MSKVYVVRSARGLNDEYETWNEKCFLDREKAVEYAEKLDQEHITKPHFVTDKFERDLRKCSKELLNAEPSEWKQKIIDKMYAKGWLLTENMLDTYMDWRSRKYADWHKCDIDELELI